MAVKPAIIPNLRYKDALGAIDFLCAAFGFEKKSVHVDDADPTLVHNAQLLRDGNMIMVSSVRDSEWTQKASMTTAADAGGNTQALYIVIDDVESHCEQARAAGATIIMEPESQDYGGANYGALDPEGNAWSFGNYDPFAD